MRKKHITAWIVGAVLALGTAAMAATVTLTVSGISTEATASGNTPCQTSALTATFGDPSWNNTTNKYVYSYITIGGIDAACLGSSHRVFVSVVDSSGTRIGGSYTVSAPNTGSTVQVIGMDGDWPVATASAVHVAIK